MGKAERGKKCLILLFSHSLLHPLTSCWVSAVSRGLGTWASKEAEDPHCTAGPHEMYLFKVGSWFPIGHCTTDDWFKRISAILSPVANCSGVSMGPSSAHWKMRKSVYDSWKASPALIKKELVEGMEHSSLSPVICADGTMTVSRPSCCAPEDRRWRQLWHREMRGTASSLTSWATTSLTPKATLPLDFVFWRIRSFPSLSATVGGGFCYLHPKAS